MFGAPLPLGRTKHAVWVSLAHKLRLQASPRWGGCSYAIHFARPPFGSRNTCAENYIIMRSVGHCIGDLLGSASG